MVLARSDVLWAQNQLFNKLCSVYVRTRDISFIRAEDLQKELAIPDHLFAEALRAFRVSDQLTVEVIDSGGESYLRLGQRGRDNFE
jgi:hypothetical protein